MATAYWRQASWKVGSAQALRDKWLTAAVDWPGGAPGRLGADGAAKHQEDLERDLFPSEKVKQDHGLRELKYVQKPNKIPLTTS